VAALPLRSTVQSAPGPLLPDFTKGIDPTADATIASRGAIGQQQKHDLLMTDPSYREVAMNQHSKASSAGAAIVAVLSVVAAVGALYAPLFLL
jgi:hypothetical protein